VEDAAVSKAADSNKQALSPWVLLAVAQCFVLALGCNLLDVDVLAPSERGRPGSSHCGFAV
jgi:hypothetical protein